MKCENFKELTDWHLTVLRQHISDNKYYLGEKGRIVNTDIAEEDFFRLYGAKVCHDLRLTFCNDRCKVVSCELRDLFNSQG